jgi:hypothetical protein
MFAVDLRDLLSGKGVTDHEGVIIEPESEEDMEASAKRKNSATKKKGSKGKGKKSKDVQKELPSPTELNLQDISMSDFGSSGHKPHSYIFDLFTNVLVLFRT